MIEPCEMGLINRMKVNSGNELSLMEVHHSLADFMRLEIVRQLDDAGKKTCGMFGIDTPKSSRSRHFRIPR
jgi:hypothetical protein